MSRSARARPARASASAVDLIPLLERRLLFVTGKGGTGKSTIASALAVQAARDGKRTLLVEMDAKGSIGSLFGVAAVGYDPVSVAPNLSVMSMRTEQSLREYLKVHLRIPLITKIGPLASTFDFVADAAPGVREVLAVGKVCWEVKENRFDLVVVDAEASGHVVAQISSPRTIRSLVPRGPLRDQTNWMLGILDDPARCGAVLVTTPEELPVTETVALARRLRAETKTDIAAVIVNALEPEVEENTLRLANDEWFVATAPRHAETVVGAHARRTGQDDCVNELRSALPHDVLLTVPLHDESGPGLVGAIAQSLTGVQGVR